MTNKHKALTAWTAAALCVGVATGGCSTRQAQEPPVPVISGPVTVIWMDSADELWSDDRSRIDTPLLSVGLEAETQWAIFGQCSQDAELFCTVMAIASAESGFDTTTVGDNGDSIGMMQINTRWHMGRMEALGVTDLADPVQCAVVAVDYLLELEEIMEAGPEDHATLIAYNCGPARAKKLLAAGTTSTNYSEAVQEVYRTYIAEMEWAQ